MTHRPGDNTDDGDDSVSFLSPGPETGQIRAGGWEGGGGGERDHRGRGRGGAGGRQGAEGARVPDWGAFRTG